jgi:hypothetical protein
LNNSAIPSRLSVVFSVNGDKNTIPTNSTSETLAQGLAAMDSGFPPLTRTALSAGGKPPQGQDFNGIFNDIYTRLQWSAAGMGYPFNAGFNTAIAGYPKGAVIPSSNYAVSWINTVDSNNTAPEKTDATSSGWIPSWGCGSATISISTANVKVTDLQAANPRLILTGALTGNRILYLPPWVKDWTIENNCTGSSYYVLLSTVAGGDTVKSSPGTITPVHCDGVGISSLLAANGKSVFMASGSFTVPDNVTRIKVTIVGGGGSGGGCQGSSVNETIGGAGGGAGGTAIAWLTVSPGMVYAVTVGAGGAAVTGASGGNDGRDSSFGTSIIAKGGRGGGYNNTANGGGAGGSATGGDINISGGEGADGQAGEYLYPGNGGASSMGGGGRAGDKGGNAGNAYGSGGGGAYDTAKSGTRYSGGAGKQGIVIVEW